MSMNQSLLVKYPESPRDIPIPSPRRLLTILAVIIFAAEIFTMVILFFLEIQNYVFVALLDGVLMLALILPGLYFLQLKPLVTQIKERDRAEIALLANEELLRRVLELLPVGFWIVDDSETIITANPASRQIWGTEELAGVKPYRAFNLRQLPDTGRDKPDEWAVSRAVSQGKATLNEEFEIDLLDGGRKTILMSVVPLPDERGSPQGAVVVSQDITDRRTAEQKIAQQNDELLALYKSEYAARKFAETLSIASQALTESLDLEHVMNTMLEHICKIIPAGTAVASLLEDEHLLTVRAVRSSGGESQSVEAAFKPIDRITNAVYNRLQETRSYIKIPNLAAHLDGGQPSGSAPIHHWLVLPIVASNKIIGLVELGETEEAAADAEQIRWAEAIVAQAAVAIQNAWLFEQTRSSSERLQSLSHRLVKIQENEREYIARELHDEAGQALSSLKLGLGRLEQDQGCTPRVRDGLRELKAVVDRVLEGLHRMAMDLRPVALDHLGLVAALEQYVSNLDSEQLATKFKTVGFDGNRLPREVETAIYRIVQEALTNIIRHARASQVGILLEQREKLKLFVEDDGVGFSPAQVDLTTHMGLVGMRERAEMLGGNLVIESAPGGGTSIIVELPYANTGSHH